MKWNVNGVDQSLRKFGHLYAGEFIYTQWGGNDVKKYKIDWISKTPGVTTFICYRGVEFRISRRSLDLSFIVVSDSCSISVSLDILIDKCGIDEDYLNILKVY